MIRKRCTSNVFDRFETHFGCAGSDIRLTCSCANCLLVHSWYECGLAPQDVEACPVD